MWPLTGSRARPDATVRWRKRTQIAGAWFPAEPCEEELEAGRAIRAEPEPVVRRQPERIDGGLGSTGDLLQQRVVTVLGALRERDQRAREAAGLLGERDGLGVID